MRAFYGNLTDHLMKPQAVDQVLLSVGERTRTSARTVGRGSLVPACRQWTEDGYDYYHANSGRGTAFCSDMPKVRTVPASADQRGNCERGGGQERGRGPDMVPGGPAAA